MVELPVGASFGTMGAAEAAMQGAHVLNDLFGATAPVSRYIEQLTNLVWPNAMPSVDDVVAAWRAGIATDATLRSICNAAGVWEPQRGARRDVPHDWVSRGHKTAWECVWESRVQIPSPGDLLFLLNLGRVNRQEYSRLMKRHGWWNEDYLDLSLYAAKNVVPFPDALVAMAIKDVWQEQIVRDYGYDDEFPDTFKYWMGVQNAAGDARLRDDRGNPVGAPVSWANLYWRAHWANISPTQAYEMYQRLRPGRIDRLGADFRDMSPFTFSNLTDQLKINDYPARVRKWLAAIAFRTPRLVDIDRFYSDGAIGPSEVYELHLDLGYDPASARLRTDWLIGKTSKTQSGGAQKKLGRQIVDLLVMGRLARDQALDQLMAWISQGRVNHWTDRPADPHLLEQARGWQGAILTMIQSAELANEARRGKILLAGWKRQYTRGMLTRDEVIDHMHAAGWTRESAEAHAQEWDVLLASGRLQLSTRQISRQIATGVLPLDVGRQWLVNLGWKEPEISAITSEIKHDMEIEQARAMEREASTSRRLEQARIRQAGAADRARNRVLARLHRQATDQALTRYYVRGVIDLAEYARELARRGLDERAIKQRITDADISRQLWLERKGGAPEPGGGYQLHPGLSDRASAATTAQIQAALDAARSLIATPP